MIGCKDCLHCKTRVKLKENGILELEKNGKGFLLYDKKIEYPSSLSYAECELGYWADDAGIEMDMQLQTVMRNGSKLQECFRVCLDKEVEDEDMPKVSRGDEVREENTQN